MSPMSEGPGFDVAAAHRYFSASCFNNAWTEIDKAERTLEETERMLLLAHASMWHWTERGDATPTNMSIGYWQLSRVHALAGEPESARKYARMCLEVTPEDDPFCAGYAHEAASRAEQVAGNDASAAEHLAEARRLLDQVTDEENRKLLAADLEALG